MFQRISYDYTGATVLITGGTSGIGLGCAHAYRDAGAEVIVTGRKAAASEYDADLAAIAYRQVDVADRAALYALAASLPKLDILVNNAGITGPVMVPAAEIEEEAWDELMNTNLK